MLPGRDRSHPTNEAFLDLPWRELKPRRTGLTSLIDTGLATGQFRDVIESHRALVDIVKFGWCTSLLTGDLDRKIDVLRANGVKYYFGGTLFEKAYAQDRLDGFLGWVRGHRAEYLEVSNGVIDMSNEQKCEFIQLFAREFHVLSEVGYKDSGRSEGRDAKQWIRCIKADRAAGAEWVITEARESGASGLCRPNGEPRFDVVEGIAGAGLDMDALIFEAPTKALQTYFIKRFDARVNLGNVSFQDVVGLETLRLGLRADTFMLVDAPPALGAAAVPAPPHGAELPA
jgi:phosphosulfolactate synthase